MTTALVTGPSGEGFSARVTELRPNSIFLHVERPLQFRDRVVIDLLGTSLRGEVVFAGEREAAITFEMTPEIFDLIEAVESAREEPAEDAKVLAELLSQSSQRLLEVKASVEEVVASLKEALVRFEPKPKPRQASLPRPDDVPVLGEDGRTVVFRDRAQFALQHEINIEKGALVVKAPPLPPGTRRDLVVVVPGRAPIPVSAQVMFQGPGTLGFSIAMSDPIKAALRAALDESDNSAPALAFMDVTGPLPIPRSMSSPRLSPAIGYESALAPPLAVDELLTLASDRPKEIAGARGSYLRALDFLLASEVEARLRVATGHEEVVLWLYRGRVVFATRKPEVPDDLLGRRMIASRVASRAAIDTHLPEVGQGKPIGAVLVEHGKLTQEALNPELKAQIIGRAWIPAGFAQGNLQVLPWSEPSIKAKLLPVAWRFLLLEVVRNELKRWTQEELVKGMSKHLDYDVHVSIDGIDPSLKLGQKEMRFYQRIAGLPGPLSQVGTMGGAGPTEGLRLAVVGCALGFVRLERADRERAAVKQKMTTEDLLVEQLVRTEHTNAFETLGIHWSATVREIRAAYDNERKKLNMRRREDDSTRDLAQKFEKRLDDALKTLNSTPQRKAIRDGSAEAMERQHAAEHLVQQAEIAMFREEFETALDLLDAADELCPVRRTKQLRARLQAAL